MMHHALVNVVLQVGNTLYIDAHDLSLGGVTLGWLDKLGMF